MSLVYKDATGSQQAMDLSVSMYREAAQNNQSLPQYLAAKFPTNADKYGTPFEQLMEQCNIFVHGDRESGINKSTVGQMLSQSAAANAITKDGVAASRLLFPAVVMGIIEDKMTVDKSSDTNVFSSMIAIDDSINGERWERPIIKKSEYRHVRPMHVAQLAEPNIMMSVTVGETSRRIPTYGIGVEVSDQAQNLTLDLVSHAIAMQAVEERDLRTNEHLMGILNGDEDIDMVALATITGMYQKASALDTGVTAPNVLSQKAWLKWLRGDGYNTTTVTHVVTDLEGYFAWENRTGQPTSADNIQGVNKPNSTIEVINKNWPGSVKFFITSHPNWPAGTYLGLDASRGIHRVKSLTADYNAVENFVIRRATQMRFDSGEVVYRLNDEAFRVLTLTV